MQASLSTLGLPTGTVALLFTDIEGSAERWERHHAAMRAALEKHDRTLRRAIEIHDGRTFKTVGDAFCAVFQTAAQAVAAALDAQNALAAEDWSDIDGLRVRMAIHTGPVDLLDSDYFGPAVNRVSRLLAIGHGGQVLISGIAKELAEGAMPSQATLRDLGAHRLKDLTQPEQVYQLVAPGLATDFPPLRSLDALPNNLPLQLTSFIGREDEVAEIETLLETSRLVTLVGSGGVGKTRLSLQVAAEVVDRFPDGVWFVELATLADAELVTSAIAATFSLRQQVDRPLLETVVGGLRQRNLLLVLDNCEHVVTEAARVADAVLRGCPNVRILASSREGLGIEGEAVVRVPSLALPAEGGELTAPAGLRYGAVALFAERAMAANRDFRLTDDNVGVVAEICRQIDGIALAIELAAPRISVLSVEQLAARLTERFRILTGGRRTALPRQQTMRALIDWSYDLLGENEKTVFCRAAIFAGSFSLDAASEICSDAAIESWDVLDVLSSLVNKSLFLAELIGSERRFRMLVSTRQYALEKLDESGERAVLHRVHAEWYLRFAERVDAAYLKTPTRRWLAELSPEFDNLRAAIDWAMDGAESEMGLRMIGALKWAWHQGAYTNEGLMRIPQALGVAPDTTLKVRLLFAYAVASGNALMYGAQRENGERAVEMARELGDREGLALGIMAVAGAAFTDATYDFNGALIEAKEIFEELQNQRLAGLCTFLRARSSFVLNADPCARALYEQALQIARATGDERTTCVILNNLGEMDFYDGNTDSAIKRSIESQEYAVGMRDVALLASGSANLAAYWIKAGDLAQALTTASNGLRFCRENLFVSIMYMLGLHFGAIAALSGDFERGARLGGRATANYAELGNTLEPTERWLCETIRSKSLEALGDVRYAALEQEGARLSEEHFVAETIRVALPN